MKTLIEIQNEVVKERGFSSFTAFARHPDIAELPHRITIIDEIAKRYATECIKASLEKAAENAKTDDFFDQRNCETKTWVDKSSITSKENIVLL